MTPLESHPKLREALHLRGALYYKREDMHPYGSHKGRSIPVMIDAYVAVGDRHFAISGSGNAARAAALHIRHLNSAQPGLGLELDVFVGLHMNKSKLETMRQLSDDHIRIYTKERPLQAIMQATQEGARSLRQSTDDAALLGYVSLAEELVEVKDIAAVFMGASSGTTAQALAEYFITHKKRVQVHIVQTSSCHPLSDAFETYEGAEEISIADAIVDRTAARKEALTGLIKKTGGKGWIAQNEEILQAQRLSREYANIEISSNSALALVGLMQAAYMGYEIPGAAVCLITGN